MEALKQNHIYLKRAWEAIQGSLNLNALNSHLRHPSSLIKKQVLVVDEDENMLKLLYSVLADKFNIVVKRSPLDAMIWLEQGNTPALVVCEYGLPHFDSASFVHFLRSSGLYGRMPVVILSKTDNLEQKIEKLSFKIDAIVNKPFNPVFLINTIQNLLHESTLTIAV